jgi:hypothetical protein
MPHVVIEDAPDLVAVSRGLELFTERAGGQILRLLDVYVNRSGRTALLECVAIEAGTTRSFFALLAQKEKQITVRLSPATDPEKTDGVKRLLAAIAIRVRELAVGSRFGKTNLQDFLAG